MNDFASETQARMKQLLEQEEARTQARGPKAVDGVSLVVKPKTWQRRASDRLQECYVLSVRAPHLMPVDTLYNVLARARETLTTDPETPKPGLIAKVKAYAALVWLFVGWLMPRSPSDLATFTFIGCMRVMQLHPAISPLARLKLHFERHQAAALKQFTIATPEDKP